MTVPCKISSKVRRISVRALPSGITMHSSAMWSMFVITRLLFFLKRTFHVSPGDIYFIKLNDVHHHGIQLVWYWMDVASVCFKLIQNNISSHFTVVGSIKEDTHLKVGFSMISQNLSLTIRTTLFRIVSKRPLFFSIAVFRLPRKWKPPIVAWVELTSPWRSG